MMSTSVNNAVLARVNEPAGSNGNSRADDQPRLVSGLVAAQAASTPQAIAVTAGTEVLTYTELDRQANRLAHILRALGVGPETVVGIYMERSPSTVMSALAVLKAGGAYLPLDDATPAERLSFMLRDAAVPVLITRSNLLGRIPSGTWQVLNLDDKHSEILSGASEPPAAV